MRKLLFSSLAVLALVQFILCIIVSPPSLAQEWTVRGKQQGTLKVVDLSLPSDSVLEHYGEALVALDRDNNEVAGLAED